MVNDAKLAFKKIKELKQSLNNDRRIVDQMRKKPSANMSLTELVERQSDSYVVFQKLINREEITEIKLIEYANKIITINKPFIEEHISRIRHDFSSPFSDIFLSQYNALVCYSDSDAWLKLLNIINDKLKKLNSQENIDELISVFALMKLQFFECLTGENSAEFDDLTAGNKRLKQLHENFGVMKNRILYIKNELDEPKLKKLQSSMLISIKNSCQYISELIKDLRLIHPFSSDFNKANYDECEIIYGEICELLDSCELSASEISTITSPIEFKDTGFDVLLTDLILKRENIKENNIADMDRRLDEIIEEDLHRRPIDPPGYLSVIRKMLRVIDTLDYEIIDFHKFKETTNTDYGAEINAKHAANKKNLAEIKHKIEGVFRHKMNSDHDWLAVLINALEEVNDKCDSFSEIQKEEVFEKYLELYKYLQAYEVSADIPLTQIQRSNYESCMLRVTEIIEKCSEKEFHRNFGKSKYH